MNSDQNLLELQRKLAIRLAEGLNVESSCLIGLQIACDIGNMDSGGIYLLDNESNELVLEVSTGFTPEMISSIRRVSLSSLRWQLIREGKPIYKDYSELQIEPNPDMIKAGFQSVAIIPLIYQDQVIGSIHTVSRQHEDITDSQKKTLETIALQLAKHIQRTRVLDACLKNEIQLQNLINSQQECIFVITFTGEIQFCNATFLDKTGYSQDELLSRNLADLSAPMESENFQSLLARMVDHEENQFGIEIISKSGSSIPLSATIKQGEWGFSPALFVYAHEESRQAENTELSTLDEMKKLLNLLPTATLIVHSQTLQFYHANIGFQKMFGYEENEISRLNFLQLFPPYEYPRLIDSLKNTGFKGLMDTQNWAQIRRDGSEIMTSIHIYSINWDSSNASLVIINESDSPKQTTQSIKENRYQEIVDQQTDLVVRFMRDGMITFVNQAYCDFLKKPADLLIGRSMFEFIPPYEQPGVRNNIALITKESPVVQARNQLIDADGQWHYVNWVDRGIFEEDELLEIQGVGRNITNEIKEKILEDTMQQRYQNLVEEMPGVVYVMHAATMLPIYLSPQIERLVGYTPQHIYQNTQVWQRGIYEEDISGVLNVLRKRAAGEEIPQHEFRFRHKDGHLVWVQEHGSLIQSEDGAQLIQGVFLDITEAQSIRQTKEFYAKFEQLINQISLELLNVKPYQWDDLANRILETIGSTINVDRSYIFQIDNKKWSASNTYEWCAEGIQSEKENLQDLPLELFQPYFEAMMRENLLVINDLADLAPEAELLHQILAAQSIKSALILPMNRDGKPCGFIGFDSVRTKKVWDDREILLLRMISQMMLNTLNRIDPRKPDLQI